VPKLWRQPKAVKGEGGYADLMRALGLVLRERDIATKTYHTWLVPDDFNLHGFHQALFKVWVENGSMWPSNVAEPKPSKPLVNEDEDDQKEKKGSSSVSKKRRRDDEGEYTREKVKLSKELSESKITISEDGLEAKGHKGYRLCLANYSMPPGTFYYEVFVGGTGAMRIGWATLDANIESPCGTDHFGYAYASATGDKFHVSKSQAYGESYGAGDTIGVLIRLPGNRTKSGQKKFLKQMADSKIEFFKNGKSMGEAFSNVQAGNYYPAVSLYGNAKARFTFGPDFKYPPSNGKDGDDQKEDQASENEKPSNTDIMGVWEAPDPVRVKRRSLRERTKPVHYNTDMIIDERLLWGPNMGPFKKGDDAADVGEEEDDAEGQAFPTLKKRTAPKEGVDIEKTRWGSRYKHMNWTNEHAPPWLPIERGWSFCKVKRATGLEMVRTEKFYLTPEGTVCVTKKEARKAIREEEAEIAASKVRKARSKSKSAPPAKKQSEPIQRIMLNKFTRSELQNKVVKFTEDSEEEHDGKYFFVYRHISAWRRCVLVPLEQHGTFTVKRRKGRPRYKANPDPVKEFEVHEDSLEVVKVENVHGSAQDLYRAVWDVVPKSSGDS